MKKDKLYLYTFIAISLVVFVFGYFSMNTLIELASKELLETQINASKREAKEISTFISLQLENNTPKEVLIKNIQQSIENTNANSGFVCMFDWSGVEICHPDPKKIGKKTKATDSFIQSVDDDLKVNDFYDALINKKEIGGIRNFKDEKRKSEIIYLYPVNNSDWIIAAHANIQIIDKQLKQLKNKFILNYSLTSFLIILFSLVTVRLIGSYYEKGLEDKNNNLLNDVDRLSKLNSNLDKPNEKVNVKVNQEKTSEKSEYKNRIMTYLRDQIISIETKDIAFININNTITTVTDLKGVTYTSNSSLDDLYKSFDPTQFFRVNRQYIISISAIDQILKYGNNQLKIITTPKTETNIIISKNKASAFKKWLNK